MENVKKVKQPLLPRMTRPLAVSLFVGGGIMLCATNALAADELTRSAYQAVQTQQNQQITGRVLDSAGEPLIGVSIVDKGNKTNGTVTDFDGKFTLRVSSNQIVVSYVGYKTQEISVAGKTNVEVVLQEDAKMLSDVVVIGYGTVKKADLSGSVAVMDNKAFKDQPITQASDALNGRMSGVSVVNSGIPGGSVKIRVRGSNSVNKSNEPLYVVDGMVRESKLDGINPEDIQSMQVLKDASSTAIYGSRGANGVVIVTTKTGRKGESHITFDTSWGISNATNLPEMMSASEYAKTLVKFNNKNESDYADYINGKNAGIDWTDVMFRTGLTQNYKIAFTKGTEGLQSYVSANYMKTEGTIEGSEYQRYSVKGNIKADITKWFNVTFDVNASRGIGKGIGELASSTENPLWTAFNSAPAMEMYDDKGNYNASTTANLKPNAYGMLVGSQSERRNDIVNGRIDLQFNICKGLTFTSSNGIDYLNNTNYGFSPKSVAPNHDKNSMYNNNTQRTLLQTTNNLTYVGSWDKHNLTATGVWEATKSTTTAMNINGSNLMNEGVGWWNVNNAKVITAGNSYSNWALLSGVARVMYNYGDKYMLTGTLRADGTSRLTNKKWGWFPSIAGAWTLTNEKFMEGIRDKVNNLKVRASYGVIGNQDIAPYSTLPTLSQVNATFGSSTPVPGYALSQIATPDLKWEKTKQFDFGFDLGLFDNRLDLSVDYFYKKTSDALLFTTTSDVVGGYSYLVNFGEVSNKGIDISVNARVIETNDFSWSTTLNGTFLKNKVNKLTAKEPRLYRGGNFQSELDGSPMVVMEGESLGSFYGYEWLGFDDEGYDIYRTGDGGTTRKPDYEKDAKILGKSTPDFTLGWNNTVTYKNWTLNAFFNSAFGVQRLNLLRYCMNSITGNSKTFVGADFMSCYGVNKNTGKMAIETEPNYQYKASSISSKWIENANYFRCENISLSYDMPKSMTKFADVRLSLSVQNLFTITNYKGSNPAGYSFSGDDAADGVDAGTYPTPRTFTFGVRFNF